MHEKWPSGSRHGNIHTCLCEGIKAFGRHFFGFELDLEIFDAMLKPLCDKRDDKDDNDDEDFDAE